MARDLSAYLQDILEACIAIEDVMQDISLEEYRNQRAVRSSVEREFIIIGEALRLGAGPMVLQRFDDARVKQQKMLA